MHKLAMPRFNPPLLLHYDESVRNGQIEQLVGLEAEAPAGVAHYVGDGGGEGLVAAAHVLSLADGNHEALANCPTPFDVRFLHD